MGHNTRGSAFVKKITYANIRDFFFVSSLVKRVNVVWILLISRKLAHYSTNESQNLRHVWYFKKSGANISLHQTSSFSHPKFVPHSLPPSLTPKVRPLLTPSFTNTLGPSLTYSLFHSYPKFVPHSLPSSLTPLVRPFTHSLLPLWVSQIYRNVPHFLQYSNFLHFLKHCKIVTHSLSSTNTFALVALF